MNKPTYESILNNKLVSRVYNHITNHDGFSREVLDWIIDLLVEDFEIYDTYLISACMLLHQPIPDWLNERTTNLLNQYNTNHSNHEMKIMESVDVLSQSFFYYRKYKLSEVEHLFGENKKIDEKLEEMLK